MAKNSKSLVLLTSVLALVFIASYINFAQYRPKVIKQVADVKGLHTESTSDLPLPEGAEQIGINRTSVSTQTTFHTNRSKSEVQTFYRNIFVSNKWEVESEGTYDDFILTRYKKENGMISVITFDADGEFKTLVSLETTKL